MVLVATGAWLGFHPDDLATVPTTAGVYNLYMSVGDGTAGAYAIASLEDPQGKILRMAVGPDGLAPNPIDNPANSITCEMPITNNSANAVNTSRRSVAAMMRSNGRVR